MLERCSSFLFLFWRIPGAERPSSANAHSFSSPPTPARFFGSASAFCITRRANPLPSHWRGVLSHPKQPMERDQSGQALWKAKEIHWAQQCAKVKTFLLSLFLFFFGYACVVLRSASVNGCLHACNMETTVVSVHYFILRTISIVLFCCFILIVQYFLFLFP